MEERLIKNLYMFAILFFIIGIPMMSMGYLDGMNANNYIIVHANITEYMHAQFYLKNKIAECHILTENNEKTHQYYEYKYPIGSTIKLFYDFNTKICRTEKFVTNLAIAGLFFFILSILVCMIGCYGDANYSMDNNKQKQNQNQTYTNINTINDTDIENQNTKSNNYSNDNSKYSNINYDIENQNSSSLIPSAPPICEIISVQTDEISNSCVVINAFPIIEENKSQDINNDINKTNNKKIQNQLYSKIDANNLKNHEISNDNLPNNNLPNDNLPNDNLPNDNLPNNKNLKNHKVSNDNLPNNISNLITDKISYVDKITTRDTIKTITNYDKSKCINNKSNYTNTCEVCHNKIKHINYKATKLICGHLYHKKCFEIYIKNNSLKFCISCDEKIKIIN